MVTQLEHDEAVQRGQEALRTQPRAISARYDVSSGRIIVELNSGYAISFPPERAQGFASATPEDLAVAEIAFPGFGVTFPRINADLWIPGLAQGRFGSERWEAAWKASHPLEATPIEITGAAKDGDRPDVQDDRTAAA